MKKTVSETSGCEGCPMRRLFPDNTFVAPKFPTGKDLNRLVIAEAPGETESEMGEPLVGGSDRCRLAAHAASDEDARQAHHGCP